MKFTVNRSAFCEALKTVTNVGKSSLLTKISGIYLYADASKRILELMGTDVITSVVKRIRDVDIAGSGEIILPPVVLEILRKTKEESVTIETDENGVLELSFGSARYLLVTRPANEFPKSELVLPTAYVSVSGLLPLLKHAAFAAETKGDKRELQGVTLRLTPGISTAEAMNQKRMASAVNRNAADGEIEMKLHISAVNILFSLLSADKTVYAGTADQRAVFVCGDTVFSTVMMNKTGPDMSSFVKRLVPEYCAVAGAKELLNAIQTAAVCQLSGDDKCVNICFTPMGIRLSCAAYKRASSAFVATLCDNPTPDAGFNYDPRIIEDFLSLTTGNVSVKLDKKGFMLLESADGVYLVTPRNAVNIKPKAKPEKAEKSDGKANKKTAKKTKKAA